MSKKTFFILALLLTVAGLTLASQGPALAQGFVIHDLPPGGTGIVLAPAQLGQVGLNAWVVPTMSNPDEVEMAACLTWENQPGGAVEETGHSDCVPNLPGGQQGLVGRVVHPAPIGDWVVIGLFVDGWVIPPSVQERAAFGQNEPAPGIVACYAFINDTFSLFREVPLRKCQGGEKK